MIGAWAAKQFVTEYLEQDLPERVQDYRNLLQLDDDRLAVPTVYHNFEPASLLNGTDDFPVCYTVITSTRGLERVDYDGNLDPHYRVAYAARTYVWDLQPSEAEVTESRDTLLMVVRTALLDHQCLLHADNLHREVKIDEGTMIEEYSDIDAAKAQMWRAGAYVAYDITLNEKVTRRSLGTVDNIRVEASNWALLMPDS